MTQEQIEKLSSLRQRLDDLSTKLKPRIEAEEDLLNEIAVGIPAEVAIPDCPEWRLVFGRKGSGDKWRLWVREGNAGSYAREYRLVDAPRVLRIAALRNLKCLTDEITMIAERSVRNAEDILRQPPSGSCVPTSP